MRLTASTSAAHIGGVEIRGVQRVMELEIDDQYHHQYQQQQPGRTCRRRSQQRQQRQQQQQQQQQQSQAVSTAELSAVQRRTVVVVPCKDEPLDRIVSVWAGIPPGSLILSVSGSSTAGAYGAEREALAAFCGSTGRRGMAVWQRDPRLAEALRGVGLTALLSPEDGLVHKGKGEALVIGIALAAVARGPDDEDDNDDDGDDDDDGGGGGGDAIDPAARVIRARQQGCRDYDKFGVRDGEFGGQDTEPWCNGGSRQDTACVSDTTYASGRQHAGISTCRNRNTSQRDGFDRDNPSRGYRTGSYKYIGFVDADNFVPGSVQEYCKAFSSGLHLASAEDAMVRISWGSKPKVKDGNIEFKKSGRSSEIVNRWFNMLLREMKAGYTTVAANERFGGSVEGENRDGEGLGGHICTGNAGEHAMSISLALKLRLASGYAIEPFHFLDIFERFAGEDKGIISSSPKTAHPPSSPPRAASLPELGSSPISSMSSSPLATPMDCSPVLSARSPAGTSTALTGIPELRLSPGAMKICPSASCPPAGTTGTAGGKVQILQVRTMNPHFHDTSKGESHIARMWMQGLSAIYHSPVASRFPEYREALRRTLLEGKYKLEGGGAPCSMPPSPCPSPPPPAGEEERLTTMGKRAGADGFWEPERCRIYPAPVDFDLLKLRNMLETSGGSFWWSGMDDDDDDLVCDEEPAQEDDHYPNMNFGMDGPYELSYQTHMTVRGPHSSPPGDLSWAHGIREGGFHGGGGEGDDDDGRRGFTVSQRDSGVDFIMERPQRRKLPGDKQGNANFGIRDYALPDGRYRVAVGGGWGGAVHTTTELLGTHEETRYV